MLAATAAVFGATPAAAATLVSTQDSLSKSEAILGGPSQLAQILAQQGARPATPVSAAPQPASYSLPRVTSAILRTTDGVIDGMPDVFGSVALKVGHTPLDWRWRSVEDSPVTGAPAAYAKSIRELDPAEKAALINQYVNRRVHYTEDIVQYGKADYWAPADQTLRRGRGDCEDYAIAKLQMLREAGVSPHDLYLVLVNDLVRRADHAILVMRAGSRMLLLDDGTNQVLDTQAVSDYRPVLTFASYGTWTHGYMRTNPAIQIAQATTAQPVIPAAY
jgi:predicted transglutaminase-like cysteine proteinase